MLHLICLLLCSMQYLYDLHKVVECEIWAHTADCVCVSVCWWWARASFEFRLNWEAAILDEILIINEVNYLKREWEREQEWGYKKLSCFYAIRFECIEQCERAFILANILLILTGNDKKESFLEYIFMVQRCFWGPHSQRHHPREHKNSESEKKPVSRSVPVTFRSGEIFSFAFNIIFYASMCTLTHSSHSFILSLSHSHTHTCKRWCLEFRANIYWCRN